MTAKIGAYVQTVAENGFRLLEEVPVFASDPYFLKITVYLYPSEQAARDGISAGGSGFLVGMPSRHEGHFYPHVVTNAHVIDSGNRYVRLNNKADGTTVLSTKPEDWVISPDDDLAVLGTYFPAEADAVSLGNDMFLDERCEIEGWPIYPGDEVYFYGRFVGHDGKQRNAPVMRFGSIAMMPDREAPIRVNNREQVAFLVECRSLSGFSGSPAFVRLADTRRPAPNTPRPRPGLIPNSSQFLGVDCGHFPSWSNVYNSKDKHSKKYEHMFVETNSGIAVVIPAWRLHHLLNQEPLVSEREAEERKRDKNATTVILDAAEMPSNEEPQPLTKDEFIDALKRVSRKQSDEEKP